MRVQVTRKQLAESYYCISVGYCEAQHLLRFADSPYYTAGTYGWNFDAYPFAVNGVNVCITTGYRGMIQNCPSEVDFGMVRRYDEKACDILQDRQGHEEERVGALLQEFLHEAFSFLFKRK